VPNHAVRIEEMLNYFPQKEKYIPSGGNFHFESQLTPCPWNEERRLLFMQLQTKKTNFDFLPPSHLIILVDVSGSMDMPNRLPLLKTAFRMLVNNLRECDTLSILSYGGGVTVELPRTPGYEKEKILKAIEDLSPGGETPGESALNFAYEYAKNNFVKDGLNRIILATDGDFNVGKYTEQALMELVSAKKEMGIYLTCLGVGVGNYKDSKLEVMAKKGNGNFAYIDNAKEGEKILVSELMQTLYVVAHNASANVEFDSASVKYYRLIGYENPVMNENQQERILEGGEIGTGHTVTAVFEIEMMPNLIDSSRLIGTMELAYQLTDTGAIQKEKYYCLNNYKSFLSLDSNYVFLAAVAEFGMLLRNAKYLKNGSWDHLKKQTAHLLTASDFWKKEMGQLVLMAADIYEPEKKKKKKKKKLF
jgi:Ca-activated chloride channel family protein